MVTELGSWRNVGNDGQREVRLVPVEGRGWGAQLYFGTTIFIQNKIKTLKVWGLVTLEIENASSGFMGS